MSMVMPDENGKLDIFSDHEKDQLVVVRGKIRRGEKGYLYGDARSPLLERQVFRQTIQSGFRKKM